jgi:photosystem II stability/assembly factor-like uncharacterized protein
MCAHNLAWPVSILTSADGGESWNGIGDFEAGIPSTLLVDPQTSSILYAAGRFGVFKSVTGGRTWFFSGSGLASLDVRALAASTPSVLYAGTGNGVFKSVDGAAHWEATAFGDFVSALAINPRDPLNLFVGTETGVYQSNDGGKHWTAMNLGLSSLNVHTLAIDAEGRVLYAATEEGVFERKLRRTLALSPR